MLCLQPPTERKPKEVWRCVDCLANDRNDRWDHSKNVRPERTNENASQKSQNKSRRYARKKFLKEQR